MATNYTYTGISSGVAQQSSLNAEFAAIQAALERVLNVYGDATNGTNLMQVDFDLNTHDILNGGTGNFDEVLVNGVSMATLASQAAASQAAAAASAAAAAVSAGQASTYASAAAASAASVNLPALVAGDVGKLVKVNATYDGYEFSGVAGDMANQNAASVAITGGSIGGITDLAVADGGTGASTAAGARTNLDVYSTGEVDALIATYDTLGELSDVTITAIASGEVLKWNGSAWINNTLAEAGISAVGHTHTEADITDLQAYLLPADIGVTVQGYDADTAKTDGTATWTNTQNFIDTFLYVVGNADQTKKMRFEVDGITTGTARTITMPDQNINLSPGTDFASQSTFASHTGDGTIHFTQAAISITESQISDLGTLALLTSDIGVTVQGYDPDTVFADGNATFSGTNNFYDDTNFIVDNVDPTKKFKFSASGITTATTRTITMANQNLDLTPGTGTYAAASHTHTESDITDLQAYLLNITGEPLSDLSDVTITAIASGEILKWSGTAWINNTLAEAGISATGHTHTVSDITDIAANYQPLDADLTAIAALSSADSNFIVGSAGGWVVESGATVRTSLGLTIGTDVQAYDADTAKLDTAQSWSATQKFPDANFNIVGSVDSTKIVAFEVDGLTTATTRTITMPDQNLNLTPTTGDFQASDAELTAIAGLASAANKIPYFTGSGTASMFDFKDEDNMVSDSATALASQQSIKAYVDSVAAGGFALGTLTDISTGATQYTFSSIPSGTKVIIVSLAGMSTSGTGVPIIRLGDSGGIETTGYYGKCTGSSGGATYHAYGATEGGVPVGSTVAATNVRSGAVVFTLMDATTNLWSAMGALGREDGLGEDIGSYKALTATLDRLQLTTNGGTDTFDAGKMNIAYL